MSSSVARPTFYEGEILPAADLVATVEYPRDQMARHDRYMHSWGIASGLELKPGKAATDKNGKSYKPVTLTAGIAADGTGREIVVAEDADLSPADFLGEVNPLGQIPNTNPPKYPWYPVFLNGVDQPGQPSSNLMGACNTSQPTRTQEGYSISFGLPGSELNLSNPAVSVADPPGDGTVTPWKILVGFVQWAADAGGADNFADAAVTNDDGEGLRYVGVNASRVTSQSGDLLLSTHPAGFTGKNPVMAVEIQEADKDGKLVFGKLNPDGSVNPVLTVAANGDLTTQGQIRGALAAGGVKVESGLATHGMTLPLPSGVTDDQVASGDALVQTFVALHLNGNENPDPSIAGANWGAFPLECYVDDQRRVHCRVRWFQLGGPAIEDKPAVCEYMVAAATKPKQGTSS